MILLIDNYDSFTYNLYQYLCEIENNVRVIRNDRITLEEIEKLNPSHIVISPGPGYPKDAGICLELIKYFSGKIPIFGVCLGHQAIIEAFGGVIVHAKRLMHGKASKININNNCLIFKDLPGEITAGRYHSLVGDLRNFPDILSIVADSEDGEIMGVQHKSHPTFGIQFHPESILTSHGKEILYNFLRCERC